ncbi:MAG: PhoH family protein, partial [Calditerrivibrio sp.]|nr:PhoH family protein [Calditerrivibrio sp.]
LDFDRVSGLIEKGVIELAPLAFMRGRTLDDAFIILDEAQNATIEQMKMFLTRMGFNSKAVITGDITQIDLPIEKRSGLVVIKDVLNNIEGIDFIEFTKVDVVRNPIVQRIIKAYEIYENRENGV